MTDLRPIRIRRDFDDHYFADKLRIVAVLAARGYSCSIEQAAELWERYSESMCAGWMCLPDDDGDLFFTVSVYFEGR